MIFALNFPLYSLYIKNVEKLPAKQEWAAKLTVLGGLLVMMWLWVDRCV
jgi:hypothetical protein